MIREAGYQENSTEALLEKAAKGDSVAFGKVFRLKRERVFRLAARIAGPSEADDIVQVVFIRLWKTLPVIRNLRAIDSWITRATVNRSIDALRHVSRRMKVISGEELNLEMVLVNSFSGVGGELTKVFDKISECLGERQKVAFVLMEMEGYSSIEAAEVMKIKSSTVRNLVMKAREKLRNEMMQLFPEYVPNEQVIKEVALNE